MTKQFSILTLGSILLASLVAQAETEAAAHGVHVPTREIFWQCFNLAIVFGALFYFLKKPVVEFFSSRASVYLEAEKKSQSAKLAAEKQYLEIKHKLENLENNHAENLVRAEADAADLRKQLLREADEVAARIKKESQETITMESAKARETVQNEFIQKTLEAARSVLSKDIGAQDHTRLQANFAQTVKEVQP